MVVRLASKVISFEGGRVAVGGRGVGSAGGVPGPGLPAHFRHFPPRPLNSRPSPGYSARRDKDRPPVTVLAHADHPAAGAKRSHAQDGYSVPGPVRTLAPAGEVTVAVGSPALRIGRIDLGLIAGQVDQG